VGVLVIASQRFGGPDSFGMRTVTLQVNKPVLTKIQTPLPDIAAAFSIVVEKIGEPHYDDPSLALLFSQLRSKTLQAVQGTCEISGRSEFNFVLQMARVFCRMGV